MPRASKLKRASTYMAIAEELRACAKRDEVIQIGSMAYLAQDIVEALDAMIREMRATEAAYLAYVAQASRERVREASVRALVQELQPWARARLGPSAFALRPSSRRAGSVASKRRSVRAKLAQRTEASRAQVGATSKRPRKKLKG